MMKGKEGILCGIEMDTSGLPIPKVSLLSGSRDLEYEWPGSHCPARNLLLRDLYEVLHVYVDKSGVQGAGEGLFARRNIGKGSLVAVFNGTRVRRMRTWTTFENRESEFMIRVDGNVDLDIPDELSCVSGYCATLGHKVCHSFENNARFEGLRHPRFGRVMCIMALRDISKGEEIMANYGYSLLKAPSWYRHLYSQHKNSHSSM